MREREEYQSYVRANRDEYLAERAALPSRGWRAKWQAFRAELARRAAEREAIRVAPKHRISGPRLVTDWHTPEVNATLPLAGQRCLNRDCREIMLPGSDPLHFSGLCGKCLMHNQGTAAPPLAASDDGPRAA